MAISPIRVGQITNAAVYLNSNLLLGRVKEFEIPEFSYKMVTHEALGMIGIIELPSRAVDALSGKITFDYVDPEVDMEVMNPTTVHRWDLRSRVDVFDAGGLNRDLTYRRTISIGAMFKKSDALSFKLGENVERPIEISVISLIDKVSNLSVPLMEYDPFNNIHNINGVPVWPD